MREREGLAVLSYAATVRPDVRRRFHAAGPPHDRTPIARRGVAQLRRRERTIGSHCSSTVVRPHGVRTVFVRLLVIVPLLPVLGVGTSAVSSRRRGVTRGAGEDAHFLSDTAAVPASVSAVARVSARWRRYAITPSGRSLDGAQLVLPRSASTTVVVRNGACTVPSRRSRAGACVEGSRT
jgi:hypothetical protein